MDEKLKTKKLLVTCLNNNKISGKNHMDQFITGIYEEIE